MKKILIIVLMVLVGIYSLASPQQHHRLYQAMAGFLTSANSIFTQNTPGVWSWYTASNWQSNSIPVPSPSVNASITFFPTTNTLLTGNITISSDPANVVINILNINGGG